MSRWLRCRVHVDRFIAAVLAVVTAPVLAALALLVRRDGAPGLITLQRVGQHGRRFGMWKLRSMAPAANAAGAPITRAEDERITPLGKRLRLYRLDELPQLFNVIRGEMALIGPRPETPEYVDPRDPRWQKVLRGKPGIGGLTQALVATWEAEALVADCCDDVYRHEILPVKLAIDAWYVEHASPAIDLLLLVSILQQFLGRPSATGARRRLEELVPVATGVPVPTTLEHRAARSRSPRPPVLCESSSNSRINP
jgi:lipopolysaccharide/colanic/teichoic acid biosynthesis glycosyltransferase